MPIVLTNDDLARGLTDQYERFATLLDGLDADAWTTPTRCEGWDVRDVAGHVVGLGADASRGAFGARTPDQQAAALRDHAPAELAEQLRATIVTLRDLAAVLDDAAWEGPSGAPGVTLAAGVNGLWFDAYVHADDINTALGQPTDRGPGLAAAVVHVARRLTANGWGTATLALDGLPPHDVGEGAGGPTITGDPYEFILVASGRGDPTTFGLDGTVNVYA